MSHDNISVEDHQEIVGLRGLRAAYGWRVWTAVLQIYLVEHCWTLLEFHDAHIKAPNFLSDRMELEYTYLQYKLNIFLNCRFTFGMIKVLILVLLAWLSWEKVLGSKRKVIGSNPFTSWPDHLLYYLVIDHKRRTFPVELITFILITIYIRNNYVIMNST